MAQVTVVIPTYNRARYLEQALASVWNQTYRDFEILVVDDGSTDETATVLDRFSDHVRVLHKARGGPSSARNVGVAHATGEWVAFLDSDDFWHPKRLERELSVLDGASPEVGLVFCDADVVSDKEDLAVTRRFSGTPDVKTLLDGNFITCSTVLVRTVCFERCGNFDERLWWGEDFEMWLRIAYRYRLLHVPESLVSWRIHDANLLGADHLRAYQAHLAATKGFFGRHPEALDRLGIDRSGYYAEFFRSRGNELFRHGCYLAAARFFAVAAAYNPRVLWRYGRSSFRRLVKRKVVCDGTPSGRSK